MFYNKINKCYPDTERAKERERETANLDYSC